MRQGLATSLIVMLGLSACQTVAGTQAATVNLDDPATRQALQSALARAVGRGRIELGPSASANTSSVTVLPPPLGPRETHSMALPVQFDIVSEDGHCLAVRRDTKDIYDLPGVTCQSR
ncbi:MULTISPECIES: hypothetical protein [Asticcacaulis]|uniref:hypothetical protein n=1 Tax=Asticcacaulis TaxID=76890 RepID=UPI001AEB1517|nr:MULTISPECIES: hypothetical protein [Asticcacaulis]MBP2157764.1 hypothetical protein [Asticcacaulis solisilvae]MDR6798809.1 hypothetical protein [Asticcacaulis sp. BE141]